MNYLGLPCQVISINLKGAALRTKVYVNTNINEIGVSMFQGKYQASAAVNEKPSWTKVINIKTEDLTKDKVIFYYQLSNGVTAITGWRIGDGKRSSLYSDLYSYGNESFPYDKEIQWYFQGKNFKKEKFKHGEIDTKCTMKTGEPYILDYKNLEILF